MQQTWLSNQCIPLNRVVAFALSTLDNLAYVCVFLDLTEYQLTPLIAVDYAYLRHLSYALLILFVMSWTCASGSRATLQAEGNS
jgi:hypothetical protein